MFNNFLEEINQSLMDHGGYVLEIPTEFQEYHSIKGDACIKSWLWQVPGFRRWRVTRMDAKDKLQVLNSVAYPTYDNEQPILGIDLLWFGSRNKFVAVLDYQPLIQDKGYFDNYFEGLKIIHKTFQESSKQVKMNIYEEDKFFSPWVILCKGSFQEVSQYLPSIYTQFINSYWELNHARSLSGQLLNMQEVEMLHIKYDTYSAEKDPAHGLFKSYFGMEWADRFLYEFLFPRSRGTVSSEDEK